ncbi:MAG: peptidylprolyl isomerase [Gammaproteobacteria bacterium]
MLDFVLSFHSNQVLEQRAIQQGLEDDPLVKESLENARREVLVRALMDHTARALKFPDFEQVSLQRYAAEKTQYQIKERRKVAHILIPPKVSECACDERDPKKQAEEIIQELKTGVDFGELARRLSADKQSAKHGGLIDVWLEKNSGKVVREFENAAFALAKPGDISPPVETRFGFHIIKLVELESARQLSYDEAKDQLIAKMRAEYRDSKLGELRSEAYPDPDTINYPALESVLTGQN